jgi:hypothetical protein
VKVRVAADHLWHRLSGETALYLHVLPHVEIWEVAIRQWFVRQGPSAFGRLQLRRVRWQNVQVHSCRPLHLRARMPACPVEHQEELLTRCRSDGLGQRRQSHRERWGGHGRQQQPPCPPRGGMDEGREVTPLGAVRDDRCRLLPATAPQAPQDGRETEAMVSRGPEFDRVPRGCVLHRLHYSRELF